MNNTSAADTDFFVDAICTQPTNVLTSSSPAPALHGKRAPK